MRILVVEDDPLIREFVVEALREEGYEVIHAANGNKHWHGASGGSRTCWSLTSSCPDGSTAGRSPNAVASMIPGCR